MTHCNSLTIKDLELTETLAWIVNFVANYCEPNYSVNLAVNYFGLVLGKGKRRLKPIGCKE